MKIMVIKPHDVHSKYDMGILHEGAIQTLPSTLTHLYSMTVGNTLSGKTWSTSENIFCLKFRTIFSQGFGMLVIFFSE